MIKIWDIYIDRYCFVAVLLDVSIWQAVAVFVDGGDNEGHHRKCDDVTYND